MSGGVRVAAGSRRDVAERDVDPVVAVQLAPALAGLAGDPGCLVEAGEHGQQPGATHQQPGMRVLGKERVEGAQRLVCGPRPVRERGIQAEELRVALSVEAGVAECLLRHVRPVFEAAAGVRGVAVAQETRPDVVVTDVGLPDIDGVEVTKRLRESIPESRVLVLTGTATLFSAGTLRHVAWARSEGLLPGGSLQVYDTAVLTEDNELTLALLHLGYTVTSPEGCRLTTEVMESWGDLYRQRLRWKRGAIENLFDYGLTRVTVRYWLRQLMTLLGIVVTLAYLVSLGVSLAVDGAIQVHPLWMAVTGIFIAERVVTVRSRGALQMLFAAVLLVEMTFDVFLQLVHARAIWDSVRRTERGW